MDPYDPALRKATVGLLLARDGHNCAICHDFMYPHGDTTLEHILPKVFWPPGTNPNRFWNLRLAHPLCNSQKGRKLPRPKEIRWNLIQPDEIKEARLVIRTLMGRRTWPDSAWPPGSREFLAGGPVPTLG